MSRYGRLPRTPDPRDFRAAPPLHYTGEFVDLTPGMPPVWDQGNLGSCVSHGSCALLCFVQAKESAHVEDPSRLFHYYAARARAGYPVTEDSGMQVRDGLQSLAKDGVPPEADWPYNPPAFAQEPPAQAYLDAPGHRAVKYGAVAPGDVDAIIASGFPIALGFDVFESFESNETALTGVMTVPGEHEQELGGHCVVLVSTPRDGSLIPGAIAGKLYRKARNSWGTHWGVSGYFWFPVDAMHTASDFWQVATTSDPAGPVPPPTPQPDPAPAPGPDPADVELARTLHGDRDWVNRHHTGFAGVIANAARGWLHSKGL